MSFACGQGQKFQTMPETAKMIPSHQSPSPGDALSNMHPDFLRGDITGFLAEAQVSTRAKPENHRLSTLLLQSRNTSKVGFVIFLGIPLDPKRMKFRFVFGVNMSEKTNQTGHSEVSV